MLVPSPRVLCLGWWEVSHWQLVLTAPAAPAKSLRHLRGGAAISCSPPCLICLGRDCMREAPAYSPQSSPALAKGRGGTGERGRFSEVSTAGARCPSTAVVGLVVMGELAWAVGEGKDGEWLKGGPSHVCTDARELSGQSPIQDAAQAGFPGLLGRGGGAALECLLLTAPSQTGRGGEPPPSQLLHSPSVFSAASSAFPLGHLRGQAAHLMGL